MFSKKTNKYIIINNNNNNTSIPQPRLKLSLNMVLLKPREIFKRKIKGRRCGFTFARDGGNKRIAEASHTHTKLILYIFSTCQNFHCLWKNANKNLQRRATTHNLHQSTEHLYFKVLSAENHKMFVVVVVILSRNSISAGQSDAILRKQSDKLLREHIRKQINVPNKLFLTKRENINITRLQWLNTVLRQQNLGTPGLEQTEQQPVRRIQATSPVTTTIMFIWFVLTLYGFTFGIKNENFSTL